MNTNITLNLYAATETLSSGELPSFALLNLKYANSKLLSLSRGKLLMQNLGHYLVNIDFLEYRINSKLAVSVTVNEPTVMLVVMLQGHSCLYNDSTEVLKESRGNCCYLSYIPPGNYVREFLAGAHEILLLTIPVGILAELASTFTEIQPILDNANSASKQYLSLGNAPISKGVLNLLIKLNSFPGLSPKSLDKKIHNFLLDSLEIYNRSLEHSAFQNNLQKEKADEIAEFLLHNYSNPMVNCRAKLASHFCISEATLLRLAKKRFGKSLHQHIVELRLLYGLKQLMTSDRSVKDVAESVGYSDPYHFSRAFTQHFKIPPSKIDNLRVR